MPKKRKPKKNHAAKLKAARRAMTAPMAAPRPKHSGYTQRCPDDTLIQEFGEEGASWLQDEYEDPLTVADFRLEQCIRRDTFVLDDPFTGPATCTAEQISKLLEMTFQVGTAMAGRSGTVTDTQAREIEELQALPIDHAADGADVVREAYLAGVIFLNDRDRWDFPDGQ